MNTDNLIDISGIDKAELLLALLQGSKVQGMGVLQDPGRPLTVDDARTAIHGRGDDIHNQYGNVGGRSNPTAEGQHLDFDYLFGRVLKVDISGDTLDPWGYDRDLGEGHGAEVVARLRSMLLHPSNQG